MTKDMGTHMGATKTSWNILAVDTSTDMLACALGRVNLPAPGERISGAGCPEGASSLEIVASADHLCRRQANVELVPTVDALLAEAGLTRADVDAVLCGTGPGSFTGVRIGVAAAKGLACGLRVPLHGTSTLDAVAWVAWAGGVRGLLGVVGDAMRKEVYPGLYRLTEEGVERQFASETVCKVPVAVEAWAQRSDHDEIQLSGDGLKKYRAAFEQAGFSRFVDENLWHPTGEGLLRAAAITVPHLLRSPESRVFQYASTPGALQLRHRDAAEGDPVETAASFQAVPTVSASSQDAPTAPTAWQMQGAVSHASDPATPQLPRCGASSAGDPALVLPIYTRLSDAEENERIRLGIAEPASVRVTGVDDELGDIHVQQRPMSVNDLAAVAELEARAFDPASGHSPWTQAMFADEYSAPGRTWWVIHDQGTIVGFAGGLVIDGNLEVLDVAVDPSRRRQGLAKRLLSRIAYDAQMLGARTSTLEVACDNEAARRLYEQVGYEQVGVRKAYYGHAADGTPRDGLTMKASLPLAIDVEADEPEPRPAERVWPPVERPRDPEELAALEAAGDLVLAIESSCDETAIAIIDAAGELRANVVSTQIDFHARFGGVVPEIASRKHTEAIVGVYEEAMAQAAASLGLASGPLRPQELAAVGVTQGPGLVGALVVGVAFAKGLAWAADKPLVCVNHLEGHLYANLFETPDLEPPFMASLLSGGHTMLVHVRAWGDYEVLGQTLDDAVGEAFDKVAKALGLGYPGGPVISRLAAKGNPRAIDFPRAMLHSHDYRFSLSGLKTAVITYIQQENAAGRPIDLPDLAASFQAAVIDVQVAKALTACKQFGVHDFCAGGGVTANPALREAFTRELGKRRIRVTLPPRSACTDNAAMIALVAKGKLERGETSPLTADADPNMGL